MTKITVLVTTSTSELDVALPLLVAWKALEPLQVHIVFCAHTIYEKFQVTPFYKYCVESLGAQISVYSLPRYLDSPPAWLLKTFMGRQVAKAIDVLKNINHVGIFRAALAADIVTHNFINDHRATKALYWAHALKKIRIYTHTQGYGLHIDAKPRPKPINSDKATYLVFYNENREFGRSLGYEKQYLCGPPKFFQEWQQLVRTYAQQKRVPLHALIYSRHVHQSHMDEDKYIKLILTAYTAIRKTYGDIPIVVKPHPQEDQSLLHRIIKENKMSGISISYENASVLAAQAVFAIGLLTSAVVDAFAMGIPAIIYYIESKNFRKAYPNGIVWARIGIPCAENEKQLDAFITSVKTGTYHTPAVIERFRDSRDTNFMG